MKFKAHGGMKSSPGLSMTNTVDPIAVKSAIQGSVTAEVGAIGIGLSEVPVRLRVPFLKRKAHLQVIGTVGGMHIKIDPFSLSIKEMSLNIGGLLGDRDGITLTTEAHVDCSTEMHAEGTASGEIGIGSIKLGDEDELHAPPRRRMRAKR
jgi:hypothetical protein